MPPKKKVARPPKPPSTPSEDAGEATREEISTPVRAIDPKEDILSDAWTDEQETVLFKSMIQCKPEDAVGEQFYPFDLPDQPSGENDGYWDLKFARRIDSAGPSSPTFLPHQLATRPAQGGKIIGRQSTVEDTDDPRSSPASTKDRGTGRAGRGLKGTRASRLAEISTMKGRQSQSSPDQGTEDDQGEDEDDADAMDVDEDDNKASTPKKTGKASKNTGKGSMRRSGRKR